ncbi:hypothetical protein ACFQNF_20585 [Iodobacter arcticus]|uniref:MFS transporter n=1 Tax=Iodobacter arcticus TaxID=590593 RepID=A0ABW2R3G3_9NEIS
MPSSALLVKLFAAPLLIGAASLAGRRWGPQIAGLLGGLPLVAIPIVLALWLEYGSEYAIKVAGAASAGLWANVVYMLVLAHASRYFSWQGTILCGWAAYLLTALILVWSGLALSPIAGISVLAGLWIAIYFIPRPEAINSSSLPKIELYARMVAALLLVLALSSLSLLLGSTMTGVLAGFPVAATVIPAFTLANAGRNALLLQLRGFLMGLTGFSMFFLVWTPMASHIGLLAFIPAVITALATGMLVKFLSHRFH